MKGNLPVLFARIAVIIVFIAVLLPANDAAALGTRRFARPGGLSSGSCTSWATACTLRYVLASVALSGDEIWVQAGVHTPTITTDRTSSFAVPDGIRVYGGFAGVETLLSQRKPKTNITILSGNIGANGSYHVVTTNGAGPTTILDGFSITGGKANGAGANEDRGGGLLNLSGSPVLNNVIFHHNAASMYGGGMYNGVATAPTLKKVSFTGNSANSGGGMYNLTSSPTLKKVSFTNNTGVFGGGMYNATNSNAQMTGVVFTGNWAENSGGGFYNSASTAVLKQVKFVSNQADVYAGGMANTLGSTASITASRFHANKALGGGGMYNDASATFLDVTFAGNAANSSGGGLSISNSPSSTLINVTFSGNIAWTGGGLTSGSSSPILRNVTFSGNSAGSYGGAMYLLTTTPTLNHVTVSGNSSILNSGGIYNSDNSAITAHNSIFWGNGGGDLENFNGATAGLDHSVLQGGCPAGDPSFTCSTISAANPKLGPLANNGGLTKTRALLLGSSAIDKGDPGTCESKDQRGITRPQGVKCDIGAYEFVP